MRNRQQGFTYIEISITALLIGMLAAIAIPNFTEAQARAKVGRSLSDQTTLKVALDTYRLENRMYPLNAQPGVASSADLLTLTTPVAYLGHLPTDPFSLPTKPEGFRYFNALQVAPESGLTIKSQPSMKGYIMGLLSGYGPSLRQTDTTYSPNGEANLCTYDSTNGSKSNGDIYVRFP
jgi:prepilin-type N-terminal cleavage/methylation domain-containing protein